MLEKLIQQLGRELQMEDLITSTGTNEYTLPFADNIQVEASELEHNILLKGNIAPCPKKNEEAFIIRVLETNLFGAGTRGASIGLKDEGNMLTLSRELDYNSSYKEFTENLEDFISVITFWRNETLKHQ